MIPVKNPAIKPNIANYIHPPSKISMHAKHYILNKFRDWEKHRDRERETLSIFPGWEVLLRGRRFSSTYQPSGSLKGEVVTNCSSLLLWQLGSSSSSSPAGLFVRSGIGLDCDHLLFFIVTLLSVTLAKVFVCLGPGFKTHKKNLPFAKPLTLPRTHQITDWPMFPTILAEPRKRKKKRKRNQVYKVLSSWKLELQILWYELNGNDKCSSLTVQISHLAWLGFA